MADAITEPKLIFILVPTPNSGGRDFYNHSILSNVLFQLNALRLQNKHVVISATVPPRRIAAHLRTPPRPSDARDL
jgi:UDP-glucose 6-dehydrogenase